MAWHSADRPIREAVELLKKNGFDGLPDAVTILLSSAMLAERSSGCRRYANEYKHKSLRTRLGTLQFSVPQTRDGELYLALFECKYYE